MSVLVVGGVEMEQLVCMIGGHPWQRRASAGRKPRSCPEHRAQAHRQAEKLARSQDRPTRPPKPPKPTGATMPSQFDAERERRTEQLAVERRTRPLEPVYGHLADAVIGLAQQRPEQARAALRRLAVAAETLSLDPAIVGSTA